MPRWHGILNHPPYRAIFGNMSPGILLHEVSRREQPGSLLVWGGDWRGSARTLLGGVKVAISHKAAERIEAITRRGKTYRYLGKRMIYVIIGCVMRHTR